MSRNQVIHTPDEIARIRRAAALTAQVRDEIAAAARPGMTTFDLDQVAGELIRATGGKSAFFGYRGYPGNICISVNDEVVHGIGRHDRFILKGDVVSVDVGVAFDGGVGDSARTVYVGDEADMPGDIARLLEYTRRSLEAGLAAAHPGGYVQDISRAVEEVAQQAHLGIVREYVGHGCGTRLHEPPDVPNFAQHRKGPKLIPGMDPGILDYIGEHYGREALHEVLARYAKHLGARIINHTRGSLIDAYERG